jgi:hypothetical protein
MCGIGNQELYPASHGAQMRWATAASNTYRRVVTLEPLRANLDVGDVVAALECTEVHGHGMKRVAWLFTKRGSNSCLGGSNRVRRKQFQ